MLFFLCLIVVFVVCQLLDQLLHKIQQSIKPRNRNKGPEIESRPSKDKLMKKYGKPSKTNMIYENYSPKTEAERIFLESGGRELCEERVMWKLKNKYYVAYFSKGRLFRDFN